MTPTRICATSVSDQPGGAIGAGATAITVTVAAALLVTYRVVPSRLTARYYGWSPTGMVAVTWSVAVSITDAASLPGLAT
jgi:hypothetical protein